MTELMHTPLFGLTLTLLAYQCAMWAYTRSGKMAMLHPTISGAVLIAVALKALQLDYFAYYQDINWLNFLLGPATVALAVTPVGACAITRGTVSGVASNDF